MSAEPEPQARTAVYRPRGFFRKALLAAVLAVVLTLSVGAAVLVDWDDIFTGYFGPDAAETPMAEKAFQKVNVISVCDDVAVTIREALVSEKNLYLILDYRLPDTVDRELVEMAYESEDWQANCIDLPDISYYLTGDISWEELKAADPRDQVGGHRLDRLHLILRLRGKSWEQFGGFPPDQLHQRQFRRLGEPGL